MAEWDDLRFLLAVVREGSFSAAAARLGASQPTVSRRVAALSRRLGTALLRREGGRYAPTVAGRSVAARAEAIEREVHAVAREVDGLDERPQGAVRLTAPEGLGIALVAPHLHAFRREHPGIDLVLVAEQRVVNLSRREADLALRFVRPRERELVVRRVASIPFAPHASAEYLRRRPRTPAGALLEDDDLVVLHEELERAPEAAWLRERVPRGRARVRVRNTLSLSLAIAAGAGVGMLPDYLGGAPGLQRLGSGDALSRDLYLVLPRALRTTARVRLVARFAVECVTRGGA